MDPKRLPKQALQYKSIVAKTCTEYGQNRLPKKAIKYKKIAYNIYRGWTKTDQQNKH